jgi:ubiquinone/menaquinone biosynthesis C-methylase UbiE
MDAHTDTLVMTQSNGNSHHVRSVFENTPRYLKSRQVDIRFRIDAVEHYASRCKRQSVLDIGCGDGSISLQLLTQDARFTLMDISSNMVARAKENIPEGLSGCVTLRNENFFSASFENQKFDLVVAVGVLAHVDSPSDFLLKIKGLLLPGGSVILEFTDAFHPVGRIGRFWSWFKEIIAPAKYTTNKLSRSDVENLFELHQLKLVSTFRYSRVPLPGFNLLVSYATEYIWMKRFFGDCEKNSNASLGNEFIYLVTAE